MAAARDPADRAPPQLLNGTDKRDEPPPPPTSANPHAHPSPHGAPHRERGPPGLFHAGPNPHAHPGHPPGHPLPPHRFPGKVPRAPAPAPQPAPPPPSAAGAPNAAAPPGQTNAGQGQQPPPNRAPSPANGGGGGGGVPPAPSPQQPPGPGARFPSGQSISQPSGPTPTLNSLLAGGAAPRYPSAGQPPHQQHQPQSYEHQQPPYHWPPRPLPPYPPQPYRPHPQSGGVRSGGGGQSYGGGFPGGGAPPAPYPPAGHPPYAQQRYPTHAPPQQQGLRPPYSPHQYEQGPSPQASPGGTPHSPGHAPSASPQPPHSPHAHQPYPPRPGQPSTPNAHDSESELTGQNSNDSSSGGGGGGPLVRPSPSPTGSSGSRSMSPAVGQQNIPMPPRPSSSSQAEGGGAGGATRAAGAPPAPLAAPPAAPPPQQGYHHPPPHQQHPPHPHQPPIGYKMPPHHQNYPPPHHYPQAGNYSPRPPYPSQGYGPGGGAGGPGAGGPGAAAAGQYGGPGRPQGYPPYGPGWGGPGARPAQTPPLYLKQHLQHKLGPQHMGPPPSHHVMGPPGEPAQDNGLPGPPPAPATSLVTTGPDGAPLDDGSQQSTLSNASAASGEEAGCVTPRGSGRGPGGGAPSPGAASHASAHDDYDASPSSWPRTPSSPVFNSHVPQETYRTKQKSDSLGKLYEMDESPERRDWVGRLLSFMEERRTPIAACPTISKQPLDLYRLYLLVRDRGGFVEVTKNKTWKDIAGTLGIGASSSAAYTLRKHYTKNLLAYECHFDRGGIDPQPIINQVEATTKKKANKNNSVPSPGSSNSQDSFPGPGSTGGAPGGPNMDGYGPPYSGYPPASQPQQGGAPGDNIAASNPFEDPQPRHAAPPTPPAPHRNHQPGAYPGQPGYGSYDQYGSPYPPNRPVYPPYGPEQDNRSYPTGGGPPNADHYGRYGGSYGGARSYPPPSGGAPVGPPPAPPQSPTPPPAASQEYYRPSGAAAPPPPPHLQHEMSATVNMNSQLARQLVAPLSPGAKQSPYLHGYGGNKAMPPPGQPRRHPDFAKDAPPQPPYPPQRPQPPPHHQYGAWPNNSGGQYRGQFPPASSNAPPGNQWAGSPRPPPAPAPSAPWGPPYQQGQQQWGANVNVAGGPVTQLRPGGGPPRPAGPYRPDMKQFQMPSTHQPTNKMVVSGMTGGAPKREINFPNESVEAVTPITYKRRRLNKNDVAPVEAWRLMMALKSGLLAETCWALDVLNILLFDDNSVGYFGLQHLPGLLDLLLEHFQKSLSDVFDAPNPGEDKPWYMPKNEDNKYINVKTTSRGSDVKQSIVLIKSENFTHESRKGKPVVYKSKEDDIFAPDDIKEWDTEIEPAEVGLEPWQFGSDTSFINHVMPCFQGEIINIPFARILERVERKPKLEDVKKCELESVTTASSDIKDSPGVKKSISVSEKKTKRTKASLDEVINRVKCQTSMNGENKINGENDLGTNNKSAENKLPDIRQNGPAEESECIEPSTKERTDSEDNFRSEPMEIEKDERTTEKPPDKKPNLKVNDPAGILKRRHFSEYEDECYTRDEASLFLVTESQDALARRCICLSNILRNLTFVPGNETEFSKSGAFLALMGKLLLLHHEHPVRAPRTRNYDREEDAEWKSSCSSLQVQEWWWDFLAQLREDALVCCANIGGQVDLGRHPEQVARPVLDGLLHWAVCPSAGAQDPLPALPPHRALSPRRLALEALCKLCVTDSNVDLVVATPPFPRLERLCSVLAKHLCRSEDQVLREFSVNLLHYLAAADSAMARTIAAQNPTVSLLVAFIEQAEQSALGIANLHGIGALRDNPDSMGTSLDMLRRAAGTLLHLAKHPDNKPLFIQQEQRLLSLVMSQILDQKVAAELSKVLFQCSRHPRQPTRSD